MTRAILMAGAMSFWIGLALAEESAKLDTESPAAETTQAKAVPVAQAKAEKKFTLPPGFYEKKHGKHTLYCKKDAPMGTRIKSERCMNDDQMRDYLLALQEQKTNIDRIRATCASQGVCAPQ